MDESELDRAIKDIAGADPRTIRKYKTELKERGHAFEHPDPDSGVWFLEREPFLGRVEAVAKTTPDPRGKAKKILEEYPTIRIEDVLGADAEVSV